MFLQVGDCSSEQVGIIAHLTEASIAVETDDAPDAFRDVIVVYVLGGPLPTYGTNSVLPEDEPRHIEVVDRIAVRELEIAAATVILFAVRGANPVVTWLAVRG
jgi:hypothetical protein